jgi:hypothetical protein
MVNPIEVDFVADGQWRLSWTDTLPSPTFYIYRDGVLIDTTTQTEILVAVGVGESPVFEVLDDPAAVPQSAFPPYAILAWYPSPATDHYRIEQFISAAWSVIASIADAGNLTFFWQTPPLAEGQTAQFRTIPVGTNGNDGTALNFSMLMVRHPAPPANLMTFNVGRTVTIATA